MSRRFLGLSLAAALALAVLALTFRWWDRQVEDRLGRWAVEELARRTEGTYRLRLGDLSFAPLDGAISFDSAVVSTDTARNRRRATALPTLEWQAHDCRVFGLDLVRLAFRRTFAAGGLGCDRVVTGITLVSRPSEGRPPASDSGGAPTSPEELVRPLGLSSFSIGEVSFPALSLTLKRPGAHGGTSVLIERARFEAKALRFDPTAIPGERRSLSAAGARLTAAGVLLRPDTLIEIAVAALEAEFTDSTLRLAGARHEPSVPESEWVRRVRVRRDRIRFELDSLRARGVGYRRFVTTGDIAVRVLELDGALLDVLTDKRIPRGPPSRHRTPQQVAASSDPVFRLDSMVVTRGTIVYRERESERERPGRVGFDSVRGTVLDLHLPSRGRPLRVAAGARLMGAGRLAVEASVPLDAPDFRYELSGKLGSMPARAFNRFLAENESFQFESGRVESITFRQRVTGGRAVTTLTPRYHDLSVESTGDGGGVIGSVTRTVKEFIADAFVVRSRNPDEDGDNLRTARTMRRYDPATSWTQFLWFSLRDGLVEALKE